MTNRLREPFSQHDNMASKGGHDDSSKASTKNVKPSYDGKVSTWEAFSIKGENYIRRKGWATIVFGTAPTTTKWHITNSRRFRRVHRRR